ncbi:ArsR family transcriptional regulator [Streptomyces hyaluromycini]|uniref:ArsR family transcriptional regulator n=1 Tax=Streptomyces hyaluromycini TaxID=1377993 RepID=UPI003D9F4A1C
MNSYRSRISGGSLGPGLQAPATPSRLRILARLQEGPCAATELADAVGTEQSLLDQALYHVEHLRPGLRDTSATAHPVTELG